MSSLCTLQRFCWQCHAEVEEAENISCPACSALQPLPAETNFFALFQLPYKLNLDENKLTSTFHTLSRKNHPDFFYKKSPEEQKISMENTALLNRAYRTLKDPIQRTTYLVTLVEGFSSAPAAEPPADLLEEIFTLQESLETFKNSTANDKGALVSTLISQREYFSKRYEREEEALRDCFDEWDSMSAQPCDDFTEAQKESSRKMRVLLSRRAYFERVLEDLTQALHSTPALCGKSHPHPSPPLEGEGIRRDKNRIEA